MLTFVDLFCGAGFGARGAVRGGGSPLLGLDAWDLATQTYGANFPGADLITDLIENVDPATLKGKYKPHVLLTSPECTSHSIARGAKEGSEASRETAIRIVPWIKALSPRWVVVENVGRMRKWSRHSELVGALEGLGYKVNELMLNSHDFGSAQARRRMFLICDREGSMVTKEDLLKFAPSKKATAADVVDSKSDFGWSLLRTEGRAKATLERADRAIAALGPNIPFLIVYYGSDYAGGWQPLDAPLRTVTTIDRFGLVAWEDGEAYLRMLQPGELAKAMGAGRDHRIPFGNRREKVKLCGNGVCANVTTAVFKWMSMINAQ